ncbi:MAG: DUF4301 family protein [Bacteroidia bacterium]|nr:DUF4301 family protein [Bacteroidia bacterium]
MFTEKDLRQIAEQGTTLATVEKQIEDFRLGFPFLNIHRAATVGDGIIRLEEADVLENIQRYEQALSQKKVLKFVPASGAASRMFKSLFSLMESYKGTSADEAKFEKDQGFQSVYTFFKRINDFAFVEDLQATFSPGEWEKLLAEKHYPEILRHLLSDEGLGYGNLPKGLLQFHRYPDGGVRTPAQEHLVEAANSCAVRGGTAYLHMTVSPEHKEKFASHIAAKKGEIEAAYGVKIEVSFSIQKPSTDTIAVDPDNRPFRNGDGSLLFRPGGHGALIENLNEMDADIIFIKNIDNVVPDRIKAETYRYKKAIAGVLLGIQSEIFDYLEKLETADEDLLDEIETFLQDTLCNQPPAAFSTYNTEQKKAYFHTKLNRPIRVCGMVKNEGEPGGGPFWAQNRDGSVSLQIAESAQINTQDPSQKNLMETSTHFNPVDLVCAPRDRFGKNFDLLPFRDPQTGFISAKSQSGKDLKALELPGLWNGAMSDWNTLFVEVPIITFNPVKTVNDLLRDEHQ